MTGVARAAGWAGGVLAGLGVRDLAGVLVVVLIVVVALCWVLRDEDRSRRLARIIGAWRGATRAVSASRRRSSPGTSADGGRGTVPGRRRCRAARLHRLGDTAGYQVRPRVQPD